MINERIILSITLTGILVFVILGAIEKLFLLFTIYFWLHAVFGPFDWYLLYKLYKKLRR